MEDPAIVTSRAITDDLSRLCCQNPRCVAYHVWSLGEWLSCPAVTT